MKAVFTISEDGALPSEPELIPLTTEEEAQQVIDAQQSATKQAVLQKIADLDALFKAQPIGLQVLFSGPKALAKEYADAGDWQTVRDVIEATPIPEEYAELANPVKAQLLALFE